MSQVSTDINATVEAIHKEAIIIDCLAVSTFDKEYIEQCRKGGLTAASCTVSAMSAVDGDLINDDFRSAVRKTAKWLKRLHEHRDDLLHVRSVADFAKAKKEGKLGIIFGTQNGSMIEEDLDKLWIMDALGFRSIQLTYSGRNLIGDGCGERIDGGLSDFGRQVIREMNEIGLVVDLSHTSYRTTMDAIEANEGPLIISHANCRAVWDTLRNKRDDEIKALAEKGGVMGVFAGRIHVREAEDTNVKHFVDHIEHIVDVAGIDHAGLGFDFSWPNDEPGSRSPAREKWPHTLGPVPGPRMKTPGIDKIEKLPNVTRELVKRGYSPEDIKKILGGNFLRVFEQVWSKRSLP